MTVTDALNTAQWNINLMFQHVAPSSPKTAALICSVALMVACAPQQSGADNSTAAENSVAETLIAASTAESTNRGAIPQNGRRHQLQLGLNFTASFNLEYPFLNMAKSTNGRWFYYLKDNKVLSTGEALAQGLLDPTTGLPLSMPDNAVRADGGQIFTQINNYPQYYAGNYTLEWDGDAHGLVQGHPRDLFFNDGPNRIRFSFTSETANTRALQFSQIRGDGVSGIRLYRNEHKDLLEQGKIWNPEFLELARGYDIIRTMDMQGTNNSPIRSWNDIATMDAAGWGSGHSQTWPPMPFYSVPYEVLFNLGVETERALWLHIPPQIGSPKHHFDPSLRKSDKPNEPDLQKLRAFAKDNADQILGSPEWDKFADNFVSRLVASGYPDDRPLYIELGNEIWNFSGGFVFSTFYAWGIGEGVIGAGDMRHGYGVLSARWMMALENAMERADVNYDVRYVIASHTAWPARTDQALTAMKTYLQDEGADVSALMRKTGVALTTYFGTPKAFEEEILGKLETTTLIKAWEEQIDRNPDALGDRVTEFFIDGPSDKIGTQSWIVKMWLDHRAFADKHGVKIIGAYEGGSHIEPPHALMKSEKFNAWWRGYHWGEGGAAIARSVNYAILAEFPDAILSNFVSVGPTGGMPWFDGHYSDVTPMMKMWDEFAIPEAQR